MKAIKNTNDRYFIDELGNVYSYANNHKGKVIKPRKLKPFGEYPQCKIVMPDGSIKRIVIHREVAKSFIPNPNNKPEVNHINGIKTDNRVENLEWVTRSENIMHGYKLGLYKSTALHKKRAREANLGENNHSAILDVKKVLEIKILIKEKNISQLTIAKKYGVSNSTITAIKKKRAWASV